nr:unnamed protein product [Callosobruchus analis]
MNISDSVEITHDGLTYRIFLSLDSQKCFKCKKTGHVAVHQNCLKCKKPVHVAVQCPNTLQQSTIANLNEGPAIQPSEKNTEKMNTYIHTPQLNEKSQLTNNIEIDTANDTTTTAPFSKGPFSETLTPEAETTDGQVAAPLFAKPEKTNSEKHKSESSPNLSQDAFEQIEVIMESSKSSFVVNSNQLKSLLENVHGSKDPIAIANEYTRDIKGLIEAPVSVYPHIQDRTVKNRCTRLRKKLEKHLKNNTNDNLSDTSSIDSTW